jgi:hypothetical protein
MERFSSKWSHPIWYTPGKNNRVSLLFLKYVLFIIFVTIGQAVSIRVRLVVYIYIYILCVRVRTCMCELRCIRVAVHMQVCVIKIVFLSFSSFCCLLFYSKFMLSMGLLQTNWYCWLWKFELIACSYHLKKCSLFLNFVHTSVIDRIFFGEFSRLHLFQYANAKNLTLCELNEKSLDWNPRN